MTDPLIPVPWQTDAYATVSTVHLLMDASARAGHNIIINMDGVSGAWRPKAQQIDAWNAYQAFLRGGPYAPVASDPYTGQRNHMRGAAFDIMYKSDRQFMLEAGFTPDPSEWWHFNNPNWVNMPVIPTLPTDVASTGNVTQLNNEDDMPLNEADKIAIAAIVDARLNVTEQRNRRETRNRVYKRADGTLWVAGPTFVPRQIAPDTATLHDLDCLKGDTLLIDAGDVSAPQTISDVAWSLLISEHERFRNAIADAVVAKLNPTVTPA